MDPDGESKKAAYLVVVSRQAHCRLIGDGIDDVIIGAVNADPNGNDSAGESYVVFGSDQGFGASLDLSTLNGSNGFVINGVDAGDAAGLPVSDAGDINGDGIDDLIIGSGIGSRSASSNGSDREVYVVFGSDQGFSANLELAALDGTNGFAINGIAATFFAIFTFSVSGAGDINGDGIDDLIIGSGSANPNGQSFAGASYVVFGSDQGFSASIDVSALDGCNGFVLNGIDARDYSGISVSGAGDINGDGFADLIIGAPGPIFGSSVSGESYVVFGRAAGSSVPLVFGEPATLYVDDEGIIQGNGFGACNPYMGDLFSNTDGTANPNDAIAGTAGDDNIWPGETGNDLIDAGAGNNTIGIGTGDSRVAAGAGDDFIYSVAGGGGTNLIDLGDGNNEAYLEAGDNDVTTGTGNDLIGIGSGNDTVNAGAGDDFLYSIAGGGGTNVIDLGDGNNRLWVENGDYDITTGSGADEIGLGTGTDVVNAGDGNNLIYLVDTVDPATVGNKDILTGLGDDYVQTGGGNDQIDAGLGFNTLFGGTGADTFTARTGAYNFIGDFELGLDQIELADFAFADLSFFQGTGDVAADVFGFVAGEAVLQVANTTVAALDSTANFV
ncbi:MAG: hypothetical protein AAF622_08470 [Cyanobacteria bacterium P01_C01_bin.147]